jgi:hypothetical protein
MVRNRRKQLRVEAFHQPQMTLPADSSAENIKRQVNVEGVV